MKRVKERWDQKYPEYQQASWQKLRDNAARFKKVPELMNLILVRRREEQPQDQEQQQEEEEEQIDFERIIVNQVNINDEEHVENNGMDAERIELPREELTEEDQDLKEMFIIQLENLTHSSFLQIEPRDKLPKAKFDNQLKESANRVLDIYRKEFDNIPEICNNVYAMGRAIGFKLGKLLESDSGEKKKKSVNRGNRRERNLKKETKESRQIVAKTSNELYRRI